MENITTLVCTPHEAADLLGIGPDAIVKAIRRGKLPATRSGKRWLISKYDIEVRAKVLGKELDLDLPR